MIAVLSYLDFFPAVVQRTAVATAAAMAARAGPSTMEAALAAVPRLVPLLDYADHHIVDSACLALNRITSAASRCTLLAVILWLHLCLCHALLCSLLCMPCDAVNHSIHLIL